MVSVRLYYNFVQNTMTKYCDKVWIDIQYEYSRALENSPFDLVKCEDEPGAPPALHRAIEPKYSTFPSVTQKYVTLFHTPQVHNQRT
jgi:hypothetical protein